MIICYAKDPFTNARKTWTFDFRGIENHADPLLRHDAFIDLTDCMWIAPGTFNFSV